MADVMKYSGTVDYIFTLEREGDDPIKRKISVDNLKTTWSAVNAEQKQAAKDFAAYVMGSASALIQPSSWRDDDPNEEPWTTTDVGVTFHFENDIILDTNA